MADIQGERIDFISAYCDRWCERCAFTARCSLYSCRIAEAMCGDFAEALELAVGRPHPEPGESETPVPDWLATFDNTAPSEAEIAVYRRAEEARDERVEATAVDAAAHAYTRSAHEWLDRRHESLRAGADPVLAEAFEVVLHDCAFIWVKLRRALHGRDEWRHGEQPDQHPVQNDWNGSAKVALISVERSAHAWRAIAQALDDSGAATFANQLDDVHRLALEEFPDAMAFVRPGFDEPWR